MELRHFNYFRWDSEGRSIILHGTINFFPHFFSPTFYVEVSLKERERFRNVSYNVGQVVEEGDTT
jgi:hypothetical protein